MNKNNSYFRLIVMFGCRLVTAMSINAAISFVLLAKEGNTQDLENCRVSIDVRDSFLPKVFLAIEKQTSFKFTYDEKVKQIGNITLHVVNEPLLKVMIQLQQTTSIKFKQINNIIAVAHGIEIVGKKMDDVYSPVDEEIDLLTNISKVKEHRDELKITGKVTDEAGLPLPGVNVLEKGTTNGTVTDTDGVFSLEVRDSNSILVFSFIGYESGEELVGTRANLEIVLKADIKKLDEVVVVGYGVQKKRDVTGAIVSISEENFTQGANINAAQLLNGRAPGVNVSQSSSAPGGQTKVQVRGANSINGNNDVLFVVDGLPSVSISDLSPEDIASIEVLKDASASAIYGTRAANGVILITTKTGKKEKPEFKYSAYYGIQTVAKKIDVLNGEQYMNTLNSIRLAGGKEPIYTADEISKVGVGTNWQDEIFNNAAPVTNQQLSVSGGSDKSTYYAGINYFEQDGLVRQSNYNKFNVRANINLKPKSFIDFKLNINFTRSTNNPILVSNNVNEGAGPINASIQFDPSLPAGLDSNDQYYRNSFIALDNPLALINGVKIQNVRTAFYGTLATDLHFRKDLTGTIRVGGDVASLLNSNYNNRTTINGRASNGIGSRDASDQNHWLSEFLLNYNKNFGKNHSLTLMAGTTFEQFVTTEVAASSRGFLSDVLGADLLQSGDNLNGDAVSSGKSRNRLHSVLWRMNYGFLDRYLLTTSLRVDGTSRFSDAKKYAFFPSAALAWRVSDEAFFKSFTKTISDLKFRAGYGKLGNQGIQNYETTQTLVAGGSAVFGNTISQGVVPARLPNENLKWETTSEYNIGLDYGLFDDRIYGSIEYYVRTTSDQLFNKPLPGVVGYTNVRVNFGKVQNSGFDFALSSINIKKQDFGWTSMLSASTLKNEVIELPDFIPQVLTGNLGTFISNYLIVQKGSPMQSYYGYQMDGIFQDTNEINGSAQPTAKPGEPKFKDQNGDNIINVNDQVILGSPFPKFTFGLNNHWRYKNFTLDIFIQAVKGISTFNGNVAESLLPINEYRNRLSEPTLNRWTPQNPTNQYPSAVNSSNYFAGRIVNSLTVQDASFFRLKNVILNYNLPIRPVAMLSKMNIYAAMDNILTITKLIGFDPDANATSGGVGKANYNDYPLNRTFRLGLNVTF